jgi:hypothetical protein
MAKHGSLTSAAANMEIAYVRLSAAISGRENIVNVVSAIQRDLELEDSQVLTIWPLLRVWPRELAC